jgi:Holliday junction resolvase RusA-like endonuclease
MVDIFHLRNLEQLIKRVGEIIMVKREIEMPVFFLRIPGDPISINHYYGNRAITKGKFSFITKWVTPKGVAYQNVIKLCKLHDKDNNMIKDWKPIVGNIDMTVRYYFNDKRKRDIDNYLKCMLDSLKGYVYIDDSQVCKLTIEKYNTENAAAFTEVEVREIPEVPKRAKLKPGAKKLTKEQKAERKLAKQLLKENSIDDILNDPGYIEIT